MLTEDGKEDISHHPEVYLVVGVNGVGKTTTIGKLSAQFRKEGKKVLLAAADTFRAAASEQLSIWAERTGADIVKHAEGADPAAVAFDAVSAAKARGSDVVLIDTAGRLQTKVNLMEELAKISRVVKSNSRRAPPDYSRIRCYDRAKRGQPGAEFWRNRSPDRRSADKIRRNGKRRCCPFYS